jgi:hypothetical protein
VWVPLLLQTSKETVRHSGKILYSKSKFCTQHAYSIHPCNSPFLLLTANQNSLLHKPSRRISRSHTHFSTFSGATDRPNNVLHLQLYSNLVSENLLNKGLKSMTDCTTSQRHCQQQNNSIGACSTWTERSECQQSVCLSVCVLDRLLEQDTTSVSEILRCEVCRSWNEGLKIQTSVVKTQLHWRSQGRAWHHRALNCSRGLGMEKSKM